MKTFMNVFLRSQQNEETGYPGIGEAELVAMKENTAIFVTKAGVRCVGRFNPFVGRYYVDDVYEICEKDGETR